MSETATPNETAEPADSGDSQVVMSFLPDGIEEARFAVLELADLPSDSELCSDPPDADFLKSVKSFGVLTPIWVLGQELPVTPERLAAGRRRIKAARVHNQQTISALLFPSDWTLPQILALIENGQRRPNPAADLHAIVRLAGIEDIRTIVDALIDDEYEGSVLDTLAVKALPPSLVTAITNATGLPAQTIRQRWGLLRLVPELLQGFLSGEVRATTVEEAAKLSPKKQRELVDTKNEKGKLTGKDVTDVRHVASVSAAAALPSALFSTPSAEAAALTTTKAPAAAPPVESVQQPWHEQVQDLLELALEKTPERTITVRREIRAALDAIERLNDDEEDGFAEEPDFG